MVGQNTSTLVPLRNYEADVIGASPDTRGYKAVDAAGEPVGTVDELFVDAGGTIRFAAIQHGGFLGIGSSKSLVPIEAVQPAGDEQVRLAATKAEIERAPEYAEPAANEEVTYWTSRYSHYGYRPYWVHDDPAARELDTPTAPTW